MKIRDKIKNNLFPLLLIGLLLLSPVSLEAHKKHKNYGTLTVDKVTRVYDGDTFYVIIKDLHPLVGHHIGIRVNGVDTPEMKDKRPKIKKKAIKARDFVAATLNQGEIIELRNVRRGKYFRIVADVYVDGVNLADLLIKYDLAKNYSGKTKKKWK